jgi:hypothetical protein
MKYTERIIEEREKPPNVIILNNEAATISKQTHIVIILVSILILTVQVGISIEANNMLLNYEFK